MTISGATCYGWFQIFANSSSIFLYDMAINLVHDSCLYTGKAYVGDTISASIHQILNSDPTNAIKVYPNPASSVIQLAVNNNQLLEVKVFDVLGNEVLQSNQNNMNVNNLPNGIYFLQAKTTEGISTQKIMVQH